MARCSLCLHLLSVLFAYLINEGFSSDFEGTCEKPKAPSSVKLKCKLKADTLECSAKCRNKGTVFPNGGTRQTFNCKAIEGGWPEGFAIPECEEKCDPPCENQGKCSKKKCICTPDYRGPNCQYSKSLCDPSTSLEFSGIAHCNHTSTVSLCTFDCPKETMFQSQPADSYKCSMDGVWDPSDIPNCVPVNLLDESAPIGAETLLQVETKTSGVCAAWGRSHFRTFDGLLFSFRGPCTYLLSKDCSTNSFSIHLRVDPFCTEEICKKYVTVYLGDVRYDLDYENGNIVVKREEEILPVPGSVEGLHLEKPADYLILRSSSGFRLTWDGKDTILLSINDRLKNNTCGLCGQHDGIVQNDLQMLDGNIAPQVASFVNSWKMNELGEKCQDSVNQENICSYKTEEEKIISQRADVECSVIYNAEYTPCHDLVNPKPYFTACRNEYCACKSPDNTCKCNTLAEYFRECIRLGGKIHGGWRNESVCPLDCPVGMEYFDCGSSCPKTCTKTEYDCEDEHCVDGCHCPAGMALYEGECIPESKCPCQHSNKQYQNGERITKDCNTCECQGGNWQCTLKECERRCTSAGDPHYTTFDGTKYEFMGTCSYYLVYNESFSIIQNNENCRTLGLVRKNGAPYGDRASCTKSLTINYGNNKVIFKHGAEVSVNGQDVKDFPFSNKDINIMHGTSNLLTLDIPNLLTIIWDGKNRVYVDVAAALHNSVTGLCGTLNNNQNDDFLTPDGNVEIDVSKFADKWKTDPTCSEELQNIDTRDSCDINPQKKETSEELCSILKSDLFKECHDDVDPDPFFKDCLYDMCACAVKAKECLCPSMDNYAATCAKKGVIVSWKTEVPLCQTPCHGGQIYQECSNPCQLNCKSISMGEKCVKKCIQGCECPEGMTMGNDGICIPIIECPCFFKDMEYAPNAMRTNGKTECNCKNAKWECRVSEKHNTSKIEELMMSDVGQYCDPELHLEYSDCLDCPVTCENYFIPQKLCDNNACRQGCGCQPGYILEDIYAQGCIKPTECGCTHGGKKYPNGSTRKRDCRTCVCNSGQWKCEEKNCPGFCSSWGGSHFKTFDGHLYEFQGDCEYILTEYLKTDDIDSFRITIKNEECGTSGITCIKTVKFYLAYEKQNACDGSLSENEPLPRPNYNSRLIVRKVGLYVFVYSNIGIILQWDRRSRVSIQANPSWRGKLTGLCGNFNDDRLDDFKSPAGGLVEARAVVFGHSWRLYESCPYPLDIKDPCTVSRKQFATTQCGILKSDVFKPCHLAVPLTPYFDRCVSDTCGCDKGGDCECLCTAISAYAYECSIQGIYIKWRTQDLCPVQCEECGRYEPCISTCPKMTCETKFLYSGLNDLCTNEPCVDGCEPKPCPVGQIFNNDNDFKCIPEEECKVQCMEINGILYYEGELIQDVSVGDGCQTCYCRRGNISCIGQPCSTPLPFCYKNGWTEWINTPPTITGDYELINVLKIPCSPDKITDIECRIAGTEISSKNPLKFQSQKLTCDTSVGLRCSNAEQTTGKCEDFEVKVYCDCSQFTTVPTIPSITTEEPQILPIPECTAPGWTFWMNSEKPTDEGENEDISTLRKFYKFCPDGEITDVQCRIASSGIDSEFTNEDVECTKKGVFCKTSSVGVRCSDYEIRFYCLCEDSECSDPRGMEKGEILDSQIRVSSSTGRNNKARLNSEYYWRSKLNSSTEWIEINLGEVQNITGIRTQGHPFADEWVTSYVVLYGDDKFNFKTVLDEDGKKKKFRGNEDRDTVVTQYLPTKLRTKFVRIYPQDWFNWITMRVELLGCNVKVPITVTVTPPFISTEKPVPTSPTICTQGWTEYYDTDDPSTDDGDTENITYIKAIYGICKGGVISDVQCVTEVEGELVDYTKSGDSSLKCSRITGFVCINFMQRKTKKCKNYKIRLYCDCGEITTSESVTSTSYLPPLCIQGWTDYYNTNNPRDGEGDFELLTELVEKYKFCQAHQVRNVECKALVSTGGVKSKFVETIQVDWTESGDEEVTCNVEEGLVCFNNLQGKGKRCKDYAVRFYCQCENLPVKVNPCDWSSWINYDNPSSSIGDEGDIENIEIAQKENDLCQKPALKEIQCRDAKSLKDYTETGQNNLVCDPEVGFKCYNKFQKERCYDYEYRVYCFYDWCTSRTPRIETSPVSTEVTSQISTEVSSEISSELTSRVSTEISTPSTSPCPPNEIYHECAYDCNFLCLSYLQDLQEIKLCTNKTRCVAGCRPQIECKYPYFWRDSRTCVHLKDCTCVLPDGKIIAPGSIETYECEKCQCYNNTLSCREIPNCGKPTPTSVNRIMCTNSSLGIEDGSISLEQITVSSELYPATKDRIRLNTVATESGNGGWATEFTDRFQYVQIDFLEPKNITGVITQGENGLSNWVTEYTVDYSNDGVSWQYIVEDGKTKKFKGNFDSDTAVTNYFPRMIEARYIKIIPVSWNNWISMRIDILGCLTILITRHPVYTSEIIKSYSKTILPGSCVEKMGFAEHNLPTSLITVSSSRSPLSDVSRIALETQSDAYGTGGWVASENDLDPVIDIDFKGLRNLSGIITQGQQDEDNWVTKYTVQYSVDKIDWTDVKEKSSKDKVFKGNFDRSTQVTKWFITLIEAQYLRIKPISYHGSSFAMRLEIIGCPVTFEVTTPLSRVIDYCPELPEDLKVNCPSTCPVNTVCDGYNCIDVMDCPCYVDGVKYESNVLHETADCQECICSFGSSKCHPKNCPPCPENHKKEIKENCECVCKLCDKGTVFCPTSKECIDEDRWCDGKQDCPDDEDRTCTTTVSEITIIPSPEPCVPRIDEYEAVCETSTVQFLTFDGNDFVYDICNHILFRDKENQKYVVKIAKDCSDKTNFCRRYLEIKVDGFDIIFGPGLNIQFRGTTIPNDKLWLLSRRFKKFQLMQMGETIRLISLEHGFEIVWNKYNNAKIKVSKCLMHSVNGLCGLYNGIKDDDFEKVDGTIADNVKTFGDSWSVGPQEVCYESTCPPEIRIKADEICNSLKDPIFDNCNRIIDINRQMEFCLGVACECVQSSEPSKCLCQVLEDFVRTCEQKTGYVMEEWRVNYNCVPECPPGLEWRECGPSCELTCDNFQQKNLVCSKECVPGCFCPPGLLRHGDICIKAEKCHDCICSGHGDPNYITFDEREYAFQGMCTYVLARSNDLVGYFYEFEVLGINTECPEEPGTACTAGLIVNYKNNVIRIYRGEAIRFNDKPLAYEEYPFYANGINITVNPGKSALVYIADINLIVRYFESNYGFVVELPSKLYYNATEGLCGICNFVQSDDFYHKDGYIEKDVNEFASSWFVKNDKESREHCKEKILEPPNPNPEICIFTENDCDLFVNPDPYVKSCENDVGYSRNQSSSVCHSKLQYAQKCCEKGIILDEWLAQSGCLDLCQENMVFQCTSHCQYSCDNYKAVEQFCEVPPEYQCACPEGKVLKDGSCVDPIYCKICDAEGHRVGDRWEKDQCTVCECFQDLTVNCLPKSCPDPPECTSQQTLKIDTKTECCVLYTCEDVARTCDKKCNPDEELIIELCICKPKEKCMYKHEYQIENGIEVPVREENVVAYLIGQKWIDGLCKNCTCKDDEGLVTTYCQTEKCPTPVESNDYSYEPVINEGECCPEYIKVFCIGDKQYKEGEEWSMGEKCVKYKCVNGDNGLQKIRQEYECDITCAPNFRYVEPSPDSEVCCGHCTQVACEENGKIYDVGKRWTSEIKKCYDAECVEINGVVQIVYTTVCKSNIENCPKDQIMLDETGCCQICRLECNPKVVPPEDTNRMFYFNDKKGNYCYNTYPLHNVTVCSGKCLTEVRYDYDTDYFDGMCRCCVAKETVPMSIEFECRDGSFLTKQYRKPVSCECTKCKGLIHEEEILERTPSK
ncbi:hemocytin-like [Centruroides vittatus]|uniref:hemocytin-like n=1 Tax=Centruroides vittatus TaxID=120091 RepID=UPI00350FD5A3